MDRDGDRLLTVREVAAIMRVSRMSVYRMIERGLLPCVLAGRSARVPESAIDDHLRQTWPVSPATRTLSDGTSRHG
jgi:excisionase family DNA binding protein